MIITLHGMARSISIPNTTTQVHIGLIVFVNCEISHVTVFLAPRVPSWLILQFVAFLPSFLGLFAILLCRGPNQTKLRSGSVHLQGGARHEKLNAIEASFQGRTQTH